MYTYCNICGKWTHQLDAFYHKDSVVCRACYLASKQAEPLALPAYAGLTEATETTELCEKCYRYKPASTMVNAGYYDNNGVVIRACSDCITL